MTSYGKPAHQLINVDVVREAARMLGSAVVPAMSAQDYLDVARELLDRDFGVETRVINAPCIQCGAEAGLPCAVKPSTDDKKRIYYYCGRRLQIAEGQR